MRSPGRGRLTRETVLAYVERRFGNLGWRESDPSHLLVRGSIGSINACHIPRTEDQMYFSGSLMRTDAECDLSWHEAMLITCEQCQRIKEVAQVNGFGILFTRADVDTMFELISE